MPLESPDLSVYGGTLFPLPLKRHYREKNRTFCVERSWALVEVESNRDVSRLTMRSDAGDGKDVGRSGRRLLRDGENLTSQNQRRVAREEASPILKSFSWNGGEVAVYMLIILSCLSYRLSPRPLWSASSSIASPPSQNLQVGLVDIT
jgi:hypothetical protein